MTDSRPLLHRKSTNEEMVTATEHGVHINHMASHHSVSVDGNMGTHHSFAAEEADCDMHFMYCF
jgi:hypothetical protein